MQITHSKVPPREIVAGNPFDIVEEFWNAESAQQAFAVTEANASDLIEEFESAVVDYVQHSGVGIFLPSGRAALHVALSILKRPSHNYVVVPAFCCHVVGEAILQMGLRPILVDSGNVPGTIDWTDCENALRMRGVAALVVPYQFGVPADFRRLVELAHDLGVGIIEDCANCLGGKIEGRPVGNYGDFAIFSFNFGKPICLGGGGMLLSVPRTSAQRQALDEVRALQRARFLDPKEEKRELLLFLDRMRVRRARIVNPPEVPHERFRWICRKFLGNGYAYLRWLKHLAARSRRPEDEFRPPEAVGIVRAALGLLLLREYPSVLSQRIRNYDFLASELNGKGLGDLISVPENISPAWLNASLTMPRLETRELDALARFLCSQGFCVGRHFGLTMDQQPSVIFKAAPLGTLEKSHRILEQSLDLPIHQNMSNSDLHRMVSLILQWLN